MVHGGERSFVCKLCDSSFKLGGRLKRHMTVDSGAKPFNCLQCNYSCATASLLKSHEKKHIGFEIDIGESIGDVGIDNTIGIDLHDDFGLCINVDINIDVDLGISIDIDAGIWEGIYLVDIDVGIRVKNGFDFGIGIDGGIMFVSGVSLNSMNHCSIDDLLIENV